MNIQELGLKLRYYRRNSGKTSHEIAKAIKVTGSYYSRIENGKVKPTRKLLGKIAEELKVPHEDYLILESLAGFGTAAISSENADTTDKQPEETGYKVKIDTEKQFVLFSDVMYLSITENGVVFDFAQRKGLTNEVQAVSRIGVTLRHAEKIATLINEKLLEAKQKGIEG